MLVVTPPPATEPKAMVAALSPARLSSPQAALYLGQSPKTLTNWRYLGKGPRFHRSGEKHSRVYYLVTDLNAWIAERAYPSAA